ncbi:MAG: hypothetical protein KJO36_12580 [Acidimicrobiia bacterium]|nr:hypothetical protein [Acidimicrobiia bacterium]
MLETIARAVAEHGLVVLGSFNVREDESVSLPELSWSDGSFPRSMVLVGAAGSTFWQNYAGSVEFCDGLPDPLDRWSRRIGDTIASLLDAMAVYPFGVDPAHPFLRWAHLARESQPSLIGMFIHREFGLWHAYRFGLAMRQRLDHQQSEPVGDICARCVSQPCLSACPVDAFASGAFGVRACATHLTEDDACECAADGCLSRRACPVGAQYRYVPDHARFHMQAFARSWTS